MPSRRYAPYEGHPNHPLPHSDYFPDFDKDLDIPDSNKNPIKYTNTFTDIFVETTQVRQWMGTFGQTGGPWTDSYPAEFTNPAPPLHDIMFQSVIRNTHTPKTEHRPSLPLYSDRPDPTCEHHTPPSLKTNTPPPKPRARTNILHRVYTNSGDVYGPIYRTTYAQMCDASTQTVNTGPLPATDPDKIGRFFNGFSDRIVETTKSQSDYKFIDEKPDNSCIGEERVNPTFTGDIDMCPGFMWRHALDSSQTYRKELSRRSNTTLNEDGLAWFAEKDRTPADIQGRTPTELILSRTIFTRFKHDGTWFLVTNTSQQTISTGRIAHDTSNPTLLQTIYIQQSDQKLTIYKGDLHSLLGPFEENGDQHIIRGTNRLNPIGHDSAAANSGSITGLPIDAHLYHAFNIGYENCTRYSDQKYNGDDWEWRIPEESSGLLPGFYHPKVIDRDNTERLRKNQRQVQYDSAAGRHRRKMVLRTAQPAQPVNNPEPTALASTSMR